MISYIFKNKIKNILVAIFAVLLVYTNFNEILNCLYVSNWLGIAEVFISVMPYMLIFIYIITLKKYYKIKPFLFPIAFVILALLSLYSIGNYLESTNLYSWNIISNFFSVILYTVEFFGYVLCLVGCLSNFKRLNLLRVGICLCLITKFLLCLSHLYSNAVSFMGNPFLSALYYLVDLPRTIIHILFYINILILTLTKKGDDIDITPFVKEQKLKKELKKAQKFAKENPEAFIPPVVPDGHWRCMGCGEFLPDNETECNCGYKKQ